MAQGLSCFQQFILIRFSNPTGLYRVELEKTKVEIFNNFLSNISSTLPVPIALATTSDKILSAYSGFEKMKNFASAMTEMGRLSSMADG